jgi:hypothetical protein
MVSDAVKIGLAPINGSDKAVVVLVMAGWGDGVLSGIEVAVETATGFAAAVEASS